MLAIRWGIGQKYIDLYISFRAAFSAYPSHCQQSNAGQKDEIDPGGPWKEVSL